MRNLLLFILTIFFLSFYNYQSYSQKKDSLYIKINDLNPNIKRILLDNKGNISIRMKNKFKNGFIFGCDPYNTKILTKNKSEIN